MDWAAVRTDASRLAEKGLDMKTLWKSIGMSALGLAIGYPPFAAAQQNPAPTPPAAGTVVTASPSAVTAGSTSAPLPPTGADSVQPAPAGLSPWAGEIAKLVRAGIHDDVILTYINGTEGTFNLTADQIIYLKNAGASAPAIAAMMQHDGEVNAGIRTLAASTVPGSPPTLHIVFAPPGKTASAGQKGAMEAPASAAAENSGSSISGEGWPDTVNGDQVNPEDPTGVQTEFVNWGEESGVAQPHEPGLARNYPIRQPYVEEVTDPILVFKATGRTPNVIVIEFSP